MDFALRELDFWVISCYALDWLSLAKKKRCSGAESSIVESILSFSALAEELTESTKSKLEDFWQKRSDDGRNFGHFVERRCWRSWTSTLACCRARQFSCCSWECVLSENLLLLDFWILPLAQTWIESARLPSWYIDSELFLLSNSFLRAYLE